MNNDSNNQNNNLNDQIDTSNGVNYYVNNKDYIAGQYIDKNGARATYYINKNPALWAIVFIFIVIFFGLIIFSNMAFKYAFDQFDDAMKLIEETKEQEAIGEDITLGENDLKRRKDVIANLNNLFQFVEFSEYSYSMDNDDFRFMFFVYLTKDYSDNTKTLVTGETNVEGAYSMNINSFNSLYLKFFGRDFDYSKIYKNSSYYGKDTYYDNYYTPQIVGDTIYSKYSTELNIYNQSFEYVKTTYNEKSDLYSDILIYTNKEKDEKLYAMLRYKIDPKGFVSYKSLEAIIE